MLQQKIERRRKTAENVAFSAVLWYNFSMKRDMNEPAQWRELLHKKDLEIEALHRQIDWLTQQLRRLNGRVYGCSSERSAELQEQLCLFEDASRKAALEGSSEASVLCRRKKHRGKRIFPVFR